jgi:hypothetical protein
MNLQLLNNGSSPDEKKWLNPVCYDIKCNSITPTIPFVTISNKIESNDLSSSITCNDIGIGGGGLSAVGNIDMNLNLLRNVGAIDTSDPTLNIITPTTQIINGSSEIKLDVDSIDREVIDNAKTALYSKDAVVGPAGSLLELNNDNTFTLGCFAANNGIIECRPNSLAMYGNAANSSYIMTGSNIITALSNGSGRIDREVLDTTGQAFRDPTGIERLRVDVNGVVINNAYTMPLADGVSNQVLTANGAGQALWRYPVKIQDSGDPNSFINCDSQNINVQTDYPAGKLILDIQAFKSPGQVLTSTDFAGTATWQTPIALNPFNQNLNTSNSVQFVNVNVNGNYTLPTNAGVDGEVLTRGPGTTTVWNRPQVYSIFSQIVDQTVVNTLAETTIIGGGTPTSTLTVGPNFFTPGMTFRYTTGGLFRTSANNISIRFRLRNSGVLFDSGLLVFSNRVILATPWNVEATFAYMGGTVMVTNFNFSYNAGNDARGFTSQQSNNTFNATVSNTLNFTAQWGIASIDNTITTNFGVIQKIY